MPCFFLHEWYIGNIERLFIFECMARRGGSYTGGMLEYDVFDETTFDKEQTLLEKKGGRYVPYFPAMEDAKKHQQPKADPTLPERAFAADLRDGIARALDIDPEDESLRFYTAVNSHFDINHGVDAFFEYTDKDRKTHHVTLDATGNPNKISGNADVIIQFPDGPPDDLDKKQTRDKMTELSGMIADIFKADIFVLDKEQEQQFKRKYSIRIE